VTGRVDVVVVSGEPLWPPTHGGRIRASRLAEALAGRLRVAVLAPPDRDRTAPAGIGFVPLPPEPSPPRLVAVAGRHPRLGRALLGPCRAAAVAAAAERLRPRAAVFAHTYLAAVAPPLEAVGFVDAADLEVARMRSLAGQGSGRARANAAVEAAKAAWWEPRAACRARAVAAACRADADRLRGWGARAVLVPNGADGEDGAGGPSPPDGPVTLVAGFGYGPNRHAARFVLDQVWPRLRRAEPGLRLRLVGREAAGLGAAGVAGVEVVSDPVAVGEHYRQASLVLAPVAAGGGSQVKVAEALARGRLVVATPFSARSAPAAAGPGLAVADGAAAYAALVLDLWRDRHARWARERDLMARRPVPGWDDVWRPFVDKVEEAVRNR
jgi:hypothetical protein